ncbi:hypothetical protein IW140_005674 [Coemansia sp. RSA 1813]|nr:hypothetical protein EV178_005231 [Coemansia sp. RSA 1646]KAJ1767755.1 hypothetical protein LPJ74_005183 [Coemansia sp. RSA 1843]KAJ2212785.1 hypothetical protein EV179_004352 [Coemansia sp. RSA 487]KAJ2564649.1 hypothetical protein IW140_005674 [Coemansia sp. RSA 1813]
MESLLTNLKSLERARRDQLPVLERINQTESEDTTSLRDQYDHAYRLAQQEQRAADAARDQVARLLASHEQRKTDLMQRSTNKRRRMESRSRERDNRDTSREERDSRDRLLRGRRELSNNPSNQSKSSSSLVSDSAHSPPTGIISKGSLVAARVAPAGAASEEWILATVLSYNSEKNRYTVQDDDLESPVRPTYVLSPRLVILVTSETSSSSSRRRLWDRSRNPEMPRGQRVFALYPRTTAFYHGTVVIPPSQYTSSPLGDSAGADPNTNPMYRLLFDDDDDLELDVPAHLVLPVPR